MSLLQKIGNIFGAGGSGLIKEVGGLVDRFIHTKEEKEAFQLKMDTLLKKHEVDLLTAYNSDRNSAREMQIEALKQHDKFSKRFVYYLAALWSVASIGYLFASTFFHVLNERIADTILGFLMGTIVSTIINYFYGNSLKTNENKKQK